MFLIIASASLLALAAAQSSCPRSIDCSTVRCATVPTPCDRASCAAFPRATCCPTCCSAPTFIDANGVDVTAKCDATPPPPATPAPFTCPRDVSGCVNVVSPCSVTACDRADVKCCVNNCQARFFFANGTEHRCAAPAPSPTPFQCDKNDCSTVRCATVPTPCDRASCAAFPRATCCPTCCGAPRFFTAEGADVTAKCDATPAPGPKCPAADCRLLLCPEPAVDPCASAKCAAQPNALCCRGCCGSKVFIDANSKEVDCNPTPSCANTLCADKASTDKACSEKYPRGYELLEPNGSTRCCYECAEKPTIACRCQSDDAIKQACVTRFGANGFTTSRDPTCNCLTCEAISPCATVRCASPESVKASCTDGTVVMGKCCAECQRNEVTKPNPCATVRCASPESVKASCTDGTVVMGECCARCQPTTSSSTNPCTQSIEPGNGRALLIKFGYNGRECVQFTYGGVPVEGNSNVFDSLAECQKRCAPSTGGDVKTDATKDDVDRTSAAAPLAVGAALAVAAAAAATL